MQDETSRAKPRVLIVEDNLGDVELLRMALHTANLDCDVTVIDDGRDALDYFANPASPLPDLVVMDLNLPKNDGLEILEAMRANPRFERVPVAVFSSSSSPQERARVANLHVDRFIAKPPDLDEYLNIGWTLKDLLAKPASSI
jgi:CheY-like chemotaxis protein